MALQRVIRLYWSQVIMQSAGKTCFKFVNPALWSAADVPVTRVREHEGFPCWRYFVRQLPPKADAIQEVRMYFCNLLACFDHSVTGWLFIIHIICFDIYLCVYRLKSQCCPIFELYAFTSYNLNPFDIMFSIHCSVLCSNSDHLINLLKLSYSAPGCPPVTHFEKPVKTQ